MYQENKARSYVKFSHSSNEYKEYLINYVLFSVTVHINLHKEVHNLRILAVVSVYVCVREREKQRWYQFSLNQWWFIGVFTPSLHNFYNEVYQEIILRCIWIGDRWKHQFC